MAHQPGTPSRAELDLAGDQAMERRLDCRRGRPARPSDDDRQLNELGRRLLGALVEGPRRRCDDVATALGSGLSIDIHSRGAPGAAGPARRGPQRPTLCCRRRSGALTTRRSGRHSTDGIAEPGRACVSGRWRQPDVRLLAAHDEAAVDAAAHGRRATTTRRSPPPRPTPSIADARTLRDRLAATVDVTTLDQWLDRSAAYDVALRTCTSRSIARREGSRREVREAMAEEAAARARLPPTRGASS